MRTDNTRVSWMIFPPFGWVLLFILVPSIMILALSISTSSEGLPPFQPFIFWTDSIWPTIHPIWDNFHLILTDPLYINSFLDSFRLACIATIVTLLIGYPMAYAIASTHPRWHHLLLLLAILPFWTASLIRIYAWMMLMRDGGFINHWLLSLGVIDAPLHMLYTETAVIIGLVYIYLPFMVLPIYTSLTKIPQSLIEASADLGCKPSATFWRVTLPLSKPGIITGCTFVFLPTMGEFVIPDLLGGTAVMTVGKVIWNEFFFTTDWPVAAAMAVLMILIIVLPLTIVQHKKL